MNSGNHPNSVTACRLCAAADTARLPVVDAGYRHCGTCDLIFREIGELPSPAEEHAHYLTHENNVDDPGYRAFLAQAADPLCKRLSPGASGLDFGSGPGPALAAMLTERGFPTAVYDPYFAPDPSPLARTYDFVTCTEVVEHLHAPAETFARVDALLAQGALFAVMTEPHPGPDAFAGWYYRRDPTHVAFYSPRTFAWLASTRGWTIELLGPRTVLFRKR